MKNISPLALIIIITSILLFGHFSWNIWLSSPPQYYPLEFKDVKWIGIKGNLPQGYYRKEIYINEQARNAWLKIAASDSYQLYVNGKLIGQEMFSSTEVAGIYDVTANLVYGKNVIALCVRRFDIHATNKVMVELTYEDRSGIRRTVASDETWKVAPVEEWQSHGEISWNSAEFDDTNWGNVDIITTGNKNIAHFVEVNPELFERPLEGYWMWGADSSAGSLVFQYPLPVSDKIRDAWVRIAIDGRYQLYINGQKAGSREVSQRILDIYDVRPFIKRGKNTVTITAAKEPSSPGILIDGFISSKKEIYRLTRNNWTVATMGSNTFQPITLSAPYNPQSDGILTRQFTAPSGAGLFKLQNFLAPFLWLSLTGVIWVFVWLGCSYLIQRIYSIPLDRALLIDAMTHLPSILFLSFLNLLKYDINHNISFPYQERFIVISLLLIFIFKFVFMLERYFNILYLRGTKENENPLPFKGRDRVGMGLFSGEKWSALQKAPVAILLALVIIGGILRLKGLDYQSLYHDEIHMINFTQGIFEKGYPYKMIGPIERPLATYEVLPYPIALSMLLFGSNDFAYRLPAAIFGILTIILIFYVCKALLNKWAAILASGIYTFLPPVIVWSKYLWHPQQAQLIALLTSFFFYKAIEKESINKRYLYLATASYIILYLTWEGTGFFLGALFFGLLAVKGGDFRWIRDKHLWIGVGMIWGIVIIQLLRRFLLQIPYLVVGAGNSDITSPSLFFLNPMYDPYFYINNFLWREYNFILTFLCILGIPLLFRHRLLRYYYILIFVTLFLMTNLFSVNAIRYVVYLEPFLIISAVAVLLYAIKYILQSIGVSSQRFIKATAYLAVFTTAVILWIGTNDYIYKFYHIAEAQHFYGYHWRSSGYYIDYRSPVNFIAGNYRKGDLVISLVPYATEFYGGIETDYFLQSFTARQVLYDITEESPMYLDRTIGKPTLRGIAEFNDISNRHHRIWIVAIPYKIFQRITDDGIHEYLTKNGKVVYESYDARVYLLGE